MAARDRPGSEARFDFSRTVALSDGVFAIALTLPVLTLTVPELPPGRESELGSRLVDRLGTFGSYALSFAVIALLWVRHHTFFRGIGPIDGRLTLLNLVYLGLVAFLPFPTEVLGRYGGEPVAVALYAGSVAAIALLGGAKRVHADRAGLLTADGRRELARRRHWAVVPLVFGLSIPLAFVSTEAATLSWASLPVLGALVRRRAGRVGVTE